MKDEFKRIGQFLFLEGLIDSHGGNMSVRQGDKILITRRDAMLGDLSDDGVVEVGLEPGSGDDQASRELPTHRAIYKTNAKAQAIIHAHPANAIAISITDNKIVPQDAEGLYLYKAAPIVRVRDSIGSEETVRLLPNFLNGENVIAAVKGHGSFAIGKDLEEAYKFTSSLENSCKVLVAVRSSGNRGSSGPSGGQSSSHSRGPAPRGRRDNKQGGFKSAIPPGIGVMDRSRNRRR